MPHLSPSSNDPIIGFEAVKKSKYERGDASRCIELTPTSIIENKPLICDKHKLIPYTTIHALLESNDDYSIVCFSTIILECHQNNHQYEMFVKDGKTTHDTSITIQTSFFFHLMSYINCLFTFLTIEIQTSFLPNLLSHKLT